MESAILENPAVDDRVGFVGMMVHYFIDVIAVQVVDILNIYHLLNLHSSFGMVDSNGKLCELIVANQSQKPSVIFYLGWCKVHTAVEFAFVQSVFRGYCNVVLLNTVVDKVES